jgi:glucose-1-phosphate cytidylyltransferase
VETVILCGGKGTRLGPEAPVPKPLLPVGGRPILWHIMKIYASFGHDRFVLCLGHLQEAFHEFASALDEPWSVELLDTGLDTPTGGRVKRAGETVEGDTFFVTYGDGVADVDLEALAAFHGGHGRLASVTIVRPQGAFGIVNVREDGTVESFEEKPVMRDWVNGGFFVFERAALRYIGEDSVLEREPVERLAAANELMAYRHDGFWECMDTYKDNLQLNELWASGAARWKVWAD